MTTTVLLIICSLGLITIEALLAHSNHLFYWSQMKLRYPAHQTGLPFLYHFGMWGDVFLITPLLAWIVFQFGGQWSISEILLLLIIGFLLSGLFHYFYTRTPFPDSLTWSGGITPAGWVHVVYTALGLTIVGLALFSTENISTVAVLLILSLMAFHSTLSSKVLLSVVNRFILKKAWLPDELRKADSWVALLAPILTVVFIGVIRL